MSIEIHPEKSLARGERCRELRHRGPVVEIEPKVFALIAFLCERSGEMVPRETILAELWPGTATTVGSLTRAVSLARQALGDRHRDGSPLEIIETIRGQGYRFNPDIRVDRRTDDASSVEDRAEFIHEVERRRADLFVGRRAELARLGRMLDPAPVSPIVYVFGPGGVGKSELLAAFARRCRAAGRLLDSVPTIDHRRALWCVALLRALPADLLSAMLPEIDPKRSSSG